MWELANLDGGGGGAIWIWKIVAIDSCPGMVKSMVSLVIHT